MLQKNAFEILFSAAKSGIRSDSKKYNGFTDYF
jgi:hypothetical protein